MLECEALKYFRVYSDTTWNKYLVTVPALWNLKVEEIRSLWKKKQIGRQDFSRAAQDSQTSPLFSYLYLTWSSWKPTIFLKSNTAYNIFTSGSACIFLNIPVKGQCCYCVSHCHCPPKNNYIKPEISYEEVKQYFPLLAKKFCHTSFWQYSIFQCFFHILFL